MKKLPFKKKVAQKIWDFIGIPFRLLLFDQNWLPKFGWTTLEEERLNIIYPYLSGKLLDIGAGPNNLVNEYKNGVGVDVFDWGGGVQVVEDTSKLSFPNKEFDRITYVACLNHIPYRQEALVEARRLVKDDGLLIITMIGPFLGELGHKLWWYSEDKHRGGMEEGEVGGMTTKSIVDLCKKANFELVEHKRFVYLMNHLYIFKPV